MRGIYVLALILLVLVAVLVSYPARVAGIAPGLGAVGARLRADLPPGLAAHLPAANAAEARAQPARKGMPPVVVLTTKVVKGPLARVETTIGTVQPIASVALRTRLDAQVDQVLVKDGAEVKQGALVFKLDARQLDAQIAQAQATLTRDDAQIAQAETDLKRASDLLARNAGAKATVDTARTNLASLKATKAADQAVLANLGVQKTWTSITSPITGRIGVVGVKAGNIIRASDSGPTGTLATINQMSPIYVAFSLPQDLLDALRTAEHSDQSFVVATPQGSKLGERGKIAEIDNAIDSATGTITAHAIFTNAHEQLWPGQLCNVAVTLDTAPAAITLARQAVQNGQNGNFVFLVKDNVATMRPVKVARTQGNLAVISSGLEGGETVVLDGADRLVNGSRVIVHKPAAPQASSARQAD
ncbi:MAG: efflux RND transporter periplasmic adaptor subunit [Hyphomicrobiales bacterium]|nr:efflux RND transporter periplasmic adaptor subunit [Hyphomicrobiales bacterium]